MLVRFALGASGARMDRRKKPLDVTASSVSAGTVMLRGSEFSSPPLDKNLDLVWLSRKQEPEPGLFQLGTRPNFLTGFSPRTYTRTGIPSFDTDLNLISFPL